MGAIQCSTVGTVLSLTVVRNGSSQVVKATVGETLIGSATRLGHAGDPRRGLSSGRTPSRLTALRHGHLVAGCGPPGGFGGPVGSQTVQVRPEAHGQAGDVGGAEAGGLRHLWTHQPA